MGRCPHSALQTVDAWLLLVLKLQPTEIDALEMEDYWNWFELAQEKASARAQSG